MLFNFILFNFDILVLIYDDNCKFVNVYIWILGRNNNGIFSILLYNCFCILIEINEKKVIFV